MPRRITNFGNRALADAHSTHVGGADHPSSQFFIVHDCYGVARGALGSGIALASEVTRRLACAGAGAPSQPPAGALTCVAASGCGSATHVRTAACAAAAVAASSLV